MISLLAVLSGQMIISSVIWVICIGLVFWLLWWLLQYIAPPEPFMKIGRAIIAIAAVIFLINVLLGLAGHPFIVW